MNILIKLMSIVSLVIAPHLNAKLEKKLSTDQPIKKEIRMQSVNAHVIKMDKKA